MGEPAPQTSVRAWGLPPREAAAAQIPPAAPLISRADAVPLVLLAAILLLLFGRVLFTGQMFFYRDVFSYTYPRAMFIHAVLRSGHLPYWNPYFSFGEPVLANPNFLFFYPTTLLVALLPVGLAYSLHYVLHFAWMALGTYLLARRWEQSRTAAFFAAAVFTFSGPVLSLGNLYNQVAAAAWIPWALLATDYAVRGRSRRPWILLAVVFAVQFLGAEAFTLLATAAIALAFALSQIAGTGSARARRVVRVVLAFAAVGALMLALSAVGLMPALEVLHRARRGTTGLPFGETVYWSLHPLSLLDSVLPGFFGGVLDSPSLWTYVLAGRNQPYYVSVFVGFVPLFLACVGWSEGSDPRRKFVGASALVLLLLACGRYTPLFALVYLLCPPLALVRFPAKLLVPAVFLVAILAGWGVDVLRQQRPLKWRKRTLLLLGILGAVTALTWILALAAPPWISHAGLWILYSTNRLFERSSIDHLRASDAQAAAAHLLSRVRLEFPGLAGFFLGGVLWLIALGQRRGWARRGLPVAIALGVAQTVFVNYSDNPTVPETFYAYRPPVANQPPDPSGPYRFAFIQHDQPGSHSTEQALLNLDSIPAARGFSTAAQLSFRDRLLLERGAMLTGVEMAENLDMEGSLPPAYYEFWIYEINQEADSSKADCLLGRANVKYVVRRDRQSSAAVREVEPVFNGSASPSYLYEDLCFTPRAFAARTALQSQSPSDTLARLSDPAFDARDIVILEGSSGAHGSGATPTRAEAAPHPAWTTAGSEPGPAQAAGRVTIVARDWNTVTLRAEMRRSGYLVLLDRYDPGWRATVDAKAVPVLEADHMFRAVQLGAGAHDVQFSYRQKGLAAGAAISLVTILALLLTYFAGA
ncbi:MAG TPA: YfhO family protein [Terriglobia bacterium]|nr:YfhO family protein [Terriglobia bacterium]